IPMGYQTINLFHPSEIRLSWELTKRAFQRQMTYRAATLAGLATNFFFGLLRVAVMMALYGARTEVAGIDLQAAITYTGLAQAVIAYLSIFGWYDLMRSVNSGEVAADLLKPLSYFRYWMAVDLGRALVAFLLRGVTIMVVYALFFEITMPHNLLQWLALLVALILGWLLSFAWRFLVNLAAFWSPNALGIGRFAFGIAWVLSGFFMPLRFFPDWAQRLCHLTPFPSMVNTTIEIYLGLLSGWALVWALLVQGFWIVLLVWLCKLTLRAGVRRLVIQGG
ncbi:MAG: ABC-2 family transporter protein, partial [Caldilineaceae bacterium]|nr:ABC-2 family transporter protein [Caldilineaceae bacterium]